MKKSNLFISLTLVVVTVPILVCTTLLTSCSNSITKHVTDSTSYDSIIKPAVAQTVITNEELIQLSEDYLNDPKKVAADWTIAQMFDADAILYHGRFGGIFSAPMNEWNDNTEKYEAHSATMIQPKTAVDFFNNTDVLRTSTATDFTNAVIDPNATTTHNVRQTTDNTAATGPYIADNGYYGKFDKEGHYLYGGSRHWKLETKVTWTKNNDDGQYHYDLYSHVIYERPVYAFWSPVDDFTGTFDGSAGETYDFHYHGYWAKEWIYNFKNVTFNNATKGLNSYPYGIAPTKGLYYNGMRNEVNWKYAQSAVSQTEPNAIVKCFGSRWDADEDFYGYGHYDPINQFDVIPDLSKKENQWWYAERDSSLPYDQNTSPLNDGTWISGAYYFDNLTIAIPPNDSY